MRKQTVLLMLAVGIGLFAMLGCTGAQPAIDAITGQMMDGLRTAGRSILLLLLQGATVISGVGVVVFWIFHFVSGLFLHFQTAARIHQTTQQNMMSGVVGSIVAVVLTSLAAAQQFDTIVDAVLPR